MANARTKRENTRRSNWFDSACGMWFSDPPLETSNFMLLFLAPAIAPCNHNYGKGENRHKGRAKKQDQVSEDEIAQKQIALLQCYIQKLNEIKENNTVAAELENPTERAKELASQMLLIKSFQTKDQGFCGKAENGKEDRYLGIFSNARHLDNCDAVGVMHQLATMYAKIGDIVYQQTSEDRVKFVISLLEKQIKEEAPQIQLPDEQDSMFYMGWLMCAMLLLQAWKNCRSQSNRNLLNVLLGLELELPTEVVLTAQPQRQNISLEPQMFRCLCVAALRSNMSLEEIRGYFEMLKYIRRIAPRCATEDIIEPFIQKLKDAFLQLEKPDIENSADFIETLWELRSMQKACADMLQRLQGL